MTAAGDSRPIGVFDSGVGGLSVARELLWRLPAESLLYYGDTAHVPYGDREPAELASFGVGIARWLEAQGVKLIVIACNTISALALPQVRAAVGVPVLGMIEAGAAAAVAAARGRAVGVLATTATVRSGAYPAAIAARAPELEVAQVACPRFVGLVEAGRNGCPETYAAGEEYVAQLPVARLGAALLGCTHYSFLAADIRMWLGETTILVDPALAVAAAVEAQLTATDQRASGPARHRVITSGSPRSVDRLVKTTLAGALPRARRVPWWAAGADAPPAAVEMAR